MSERLTWNPEDLCDILGVSRATAYQLCNRSDFPAVRVSPRRIVIPKDALQIWLDEQAKK